MTQDSKGSNSAARSPSRLARLGGGLSLLVLIAAASSGIMPEQMAHSAPLERHLPQPPVNGQMGFVVQKFALTYESNADDCPDGLAPMLRESFVASLAPAERERLLKDENRREFLRRYTASALAPDNSNICTHYERFDRPPQKVVQGRTAQGFDLDGRLDGAAGEQGCAHANFTSPSGESGIDNQVWRAMGCHVKYRGTPGAPPVNFELSFGSLASGENSQVLLLRGVDSLVRDDDVEVVYANTQDPAILDPNGGFVAGASFRIGETPGGPNVLRGRIVNGVLEASTSRLQLRRKWQLTFGGRDLRGLRTQWILNRARLRLVFQPDGSLSGLLGGYQPIHDVITPISLAGLGALDTGWDCPAMFAALKKMADGDRDPRTGQCTTISTALQVHAVPAFVEPAASGDKHAAARGE
jgi:hypothetical protein